MPTALLPLPVAPLAGFEVARRVGTLRWGRVLLALGGVVALLAVALSAAQIVRLRAKVDAIERSGLMLMPRVTLRDGRASAEGESGRLIATDRAVVLFATSAEPPEVPRAYGADRRPRVVVRADALLLFTHERAAPLALPMATLHAAVGDAVVDGPGLVAAVRGFVPRMVGTLAILGAGAAVLAHLVVAGLFAGAYRVVFHRRLELPSMRDLAVLGVLAGIPGLLAGAVVVGATGAEGAALTTDLVVASGWFLLAAVQARGRADERPLGPAVATEL